MTDDGAAAVKPLPQLPPKRFSPRQKRFIWRMSTYVLTAAIVALVAVSADWPLLRKTFMDTEIFKDLFPEIITIAAKNTVILAALAFTGGILFGLVLALMRLSQYRFYRWLSLSYIELFRGIPALLTLILVGVVLPIALKFRVDDVLPFLGGYGTPAVGLAIVAAAYLAETIRGGIEAVPKGQMEAARSLGMSHSRAMATIIVPQAFRIMIPPLTNEFVLLIKDTSLIFVLGVAADEQELTFFSRAAALKLFNATPIVAAAFMYLIITLPLTALSRYLEKRGPASVRSQRRKPSLPKTETAV